MISSLTDSRNLYTIVLYLRVLSMRRKCTSLHYFLEPALWEAIRLYSLILSGKINHESLFSLYIGILRSSRPVLLSLLCLSILCWQWQQQKRPFRLKAASTLAAHCYRMTSSELQIGLWKVILGQGHSAGLLLFYILRTCDILCILGTFLLDNKSLEFGLFLNLAFVALACDHHQALKL